MKFEIIPTKGILYDKCENVEQLYDNYYYPLLVEFKQLQNNWNELKKYVQEELKEAEDDFVQEDFIKILDRMQELESNNE